MEAYLSNLISVDFSPHLYGAWQDFSLPLECNATLKNRELWRKFDAENTEMIITKTGRRMFPSLEVKIDGLCPNARYHVFIEMEPVSGSRYKYSTSGGWFPAGSEEAHSMKRFYSHPDSPANGSFWMSQTVKFGRMKLTNTLTAPFGQVVLSSMHKYQPKIYIVKDNEMGDRHLIRRAVITFPETQFIAVTAYQNENITRLKIDHNPFAKGFRETGQAKCKRKRNAAINSNPPIRDISEEFSELIVVDDQPSSEQMLSPTLSSRSVSSYSSSSNYDLPSTSTSSSSHSSPSDNVSSYSLPSYYGPMLPHHPLSGIPLHYGYHPYSNSYENSSKAYAANLAAHVPRPLIRRNSFPKLSKPEKVTDFSIKWILQGN